MRCSNPECSNDRVANFIACQICIDKLFSLYLDDAEVRAAFDKNPEKTIEQIHDGILEINSRTNPSKNSGVN